MFPVLLSRSAPCRGILATVCPWVTRPVYLMSAKFSSQELFPPENITEPQIPPYKERVDEPTDLKRARLLYQSRKRGMLENGLLLSTFAAKHLSNMTPELLQQYDRLINLPSNDWDLYYWVTGVKPTPAEFENDAMKLLKEHVQNKERQLRIRQPDLD
ncbi:succinate dehydrogenase assembly factor 2, mitochondrial-like [Schistocerca gregaria]|uniref:succinate dehydrogenase assembly factor 2, mitochondrial-like n=1 Tax=Schistocerca gregaria TaxID=7010 RepID=UPI00211ED32D|nr:succinate dehydrogenase assembly factor 2, mitochondrial-like [Schistocerca gregaria]